MARAKTNTTATTTTQGKAKKAPAKKRTRKAPAKNAGIMDAANTFIAMLTQIGVPSITAPAALGDAIQKGCETAGIKFARTEKGENVRFERTGRKGRSTGRAPQAATVAKFAAACEAATPVKVKGGTAMVLTQADLMAKGLGKTWLNTQHGWRDNYTCGAAAIACGYPVYKANVKNGEKWVVLAQAGVDIADALTACGKGTPANAKGGAAANAA